MMVIYSDAKIYALIRRITRIKQLYYNNKMNGKIIMQKFKCLVTILKYAANYKTTIH